MTSKEYIKEYIKGNITQNEFLSHIEEDYDRQNFHNIEVQILDLYMFIVFGHGKDTIIQKVVKYPLITMKYIITFSGEPNKWESREWFLVNSILA